MELWGVAENVHCRRLVGGKLARRQGPAEVRFYARAGTLAVRSSLPQLTHAPLTARSIAFQMQ